MPCVCRFLHDTLFQPIAHRPGGAGRRPGYERSAAAAENLRIDHRGTNVLVAQEFRKTEASGSRPAFWGDKQDNYCVVYLIAGCCHNPHAGDIGLCCAGPEEWAATARPLTGRPLAEGRRFWDHGRSERLSGKCS